MSTTDLAALAAELKAKGVRALTVTWCDANGIQRSRSAPIDKLASAVERGMGCSFLFAVFDTHDHIALGRRGRGHADGRLPRQGRARAHRPARRPAGVRVGPGPAVAAGGPALGALLPRGARAHRRARGRPRLRVQGRPRARVVHRRGLRRADGGASRARLQPERDARRQRVRLRAARATSTPTGSRSGRSTPSTAGRRWRSRSTPTDPLTAADNQLLARETIRDASRSNGLRSSFAPLITPDGVGNGWHFHVSILKDGVNLLSGGDGPEGMTPEGEAFVAGILRDLPGVVAVTAPSVPSLIRLRPGYFASAYAFWGADNREASLRFVPGAEAIGAQNANIELKASDASGNPYLGLTAMIACGLGGIEDGLKLPESISEDPGGWTPEQRQARRRAPLRAERRGADRELRDRAAHPRGVRRCARQCVRRRTPLGRGLGRRKECRGDRRRAPLALSMR